MPKNKKQSRLANSPNLFCNNCGKPISNSSSPFRKKDEINECQPCYLERIKKERAEASKLEVRMSVVFQASDIISQARIKNLEIEQDKLKNQVNHLGQSFNKEKKQISNLKNNVLKIKQEVNNISQEISKTSEEDIIKQAELVRKSILRRKYGKKLLKHFKDLKQLKQKKLEEINSYPWKIFYNDYTRKKINEVKFIEQINQLCQWNIWEPKTRKARIIYVGMPFVVLFVWFSNWKWNLIKKYKDWYNDPGYLDETEKAWYESMEEEDI